MEAFKAVEKEMKTKAFSKEGLLINAKQDPKEQEKEELRDFLGNMVEELGRQIEEAEAETDALQAQSKKKKDNAKAERVSELENRTERHKWHQDKMEMLMRALANDDAEPDDVKDVQEDIQHYVDNNREVDFFEDDTIYDSFKLDDVGEKYGTHNDLEKVTSQDGESVSEEPVTGPLADLTKPKAKAAPEPTPAPRRPSQHVRSPLPALASLHNLPAATPATVKDPAANMKPAPPPTKPPGETLNYRSAAAAGAANDAAGIGIAPLPPPPGKTPATASATAHISESAIKSSNTSSPAVSAAQPLAASPAVPKAAIPAPSREQAPGLPVGISKSPAPSSSSISGPSPAVSAAQLAQASARDPAPILPSQQNGASRPNLSKRSTQSGQNHDRLPSLSSLDASSPVTRPNGVPAAKPQEDESVYHLPASLQELVDCFEEVRSTAPPVSSPEHQRLFEESFAHRPTPYESERPRHYKPEKPVPYTPSHYPQQPLPVFDDPRLYSKIDQDALFYSFYYRQGTYQQYLAAKELKGTSWRFHKQYKTWFQRHEEPKQITEDFERGTYRFFDYESTW